MGPGWRIAAGIAVAAALLYARTIDHDYVLDDLQVVQQNPVINEGRVADALVEPYWPAHLQVGAANWRPWVTASWTLERRLAGPPRPRIGAPPDDPALRLFHGLNAVWHGVCVWLCFLVARRITGDPRLAWVAAGLFALHPAHVEAVAPVVGRIDLMAAAGALATLVAWGRWRETDDRRWLAAAAAAFALGIGSKESAVPLCVLLPLADRWVFGRPAIAWRSRAALAYLVPLGVLAVYAGVRIGVLGAHTFAHGQAEALGAWGRLGFAGRNTVVSAALLAAPVRFHHIVTTLPAEARFTYPQPGGLATVGWLALALPLALGWIALARRAPRAAFCWAAVVACWAPTSGLLPIAAGVAHRFLFLPTAFAAIGAVLAGRALVARRPAWRVGVLLLAGVWGCGALVLTWHRLPAWRTNAAFFRAVLVEMPESYTAQYSVGVEIAKQGGDLAVARAHIRRALAIAGRDPITVLAYGNLAKTYEIDPATGVRYGPGAPLAEAVAVYESGLAIAPNNSQLHHDLAAVHDPLRERARAAGDLEGWRRHTAAVVHHLQVTVREAPGAGDAPEMHISIAQRLGQLGRAAEAGPHWRAALAGVLARAADWERRGQPARAAADRRLAAQVQAEAPPADGTGGAGDG